MKQKKNPAADLKLKYKKTLELAVVTSLALHVGLFLSKPAFDVTPKEVRAQDFKIEVADIPLTEQRKLPPPPARPAVPVPTESEEIPEDFTIESTELDLNLTELPPPPPPDESGIDDEYIFVPYDEAPQPIGGFAAILKNLKYPELAVKAGIEARVMIGVLIDEKGNSIKTQVLKSSGSPIPFDDAAAEAVMKVKWKPAKQRDRTVKVWVSVPIVFKLQETLRVGT
ncbi:energy transducer TonB [bacterium]|nr:energy transducer TonB [bacterium]